MKTRFELDKMEEEAGRLLKAKFADLPKGLAIELLRTQAEHLQSTSHDTLHALEQIIKKEAL